MSVGCGTAPCGDRPASPRSSCPSCSPSSWCCSSSRARCWATAPPPSARAAVGDTGPVLVGARAARSTGPRARRRSMLSASAAAHPQVGRGPRPPPALGRRPQQRRPRRLPGDARARRPGRRGRLRRRGAHAARRVGRAPPDRPGGRGRARRPAGLRHHAGPGRRARRTCACPACAGRSAPSCETGGTSRAWSTRAPAASSARPASRARAASAGCPRAERRVAPTLAPRQEPPAAANGQAGVNARHDVVPAEAERVADRGVERHLARLAGHDVEGDVGVELLEVRGGRYEALAHRQDRRDRLDRAGGTEQVTQRALGRGEHRVVADRLLDRHGLGHVADRASRWRGSSRGPRRPGRDPRVRSAAAMARDWPVPSGSGAVMWYASALVPMPARRPCTVAPRACGELLALEHDDARALAEHEAVAAGVERARGALGLVVAQRHGAGLAEAGERDRVRCTPRRRRRRRRRPRRPGASASPRRSPRRRTRTPTRARGRPPRRRTPGRRARPGRSA